MLWNLLYKTDSNILLTTHTTSNSQLPTDVTTQQEGSQRIQSLRHIKAVAALIFYRKKVVKLDFYASFYSRLLYTDVVNS